MHPLSIKIGDYLLAGFANNANTVPLLITGVVASTVDNMKSYAVTAGGKVYTCTAANTTVQEKSVNVANGVSSGFKTTWVLGA